MKRILLSALVLSVAAMGTQAKSWKIGPSSVNGMDFASINAAMESSSVTPGDTLYLDQYYNDNSAQTVTKQVVIIGTGYDTSLTDEQVVATLTSYLHLKASNTVVKSVKLSNVRFYVDDCILDRCYIYSQISTQSSTASMNHIYSCYITGSIFGYSSDQPSKFDIQNCAIINGSNEFMRYMTSSIINNNTILSDYSGNYYSIIGITHSTITNNIILRTYSSRYDSVFDSSIYSSGSGNSIEHNILSNTSALTYYPTNKVGYGGSSSSIFTQIGTYSDYYKLTENSPALGYATDGGEVGCHGGMFGCPSGGRPQYIPYFSKVTVGSRTENGKLPVSVTVKIQDK